MTGTPTITTPSPLPDAQIDTEYDPVDLATSGGYAPFVWQTHALETSILATTELAEGTFRDWRADEHVWQVQLPFAFPYAGSTWTQVWVSSNGFLHFSSDPPDSDHANATVALGLHLRIAPLWDDWNPESREIWYTMLDKDGNTLIEETCVRCVGGEAAKPAIVVDSDDKVHIIFMDQRWDYGDSQEVTYTKLDPGLDDQDGSAADPATIPMPG